MPKNSSLSLIETALGNAGGQHKRKYKPTPDSDAVIREAYRRQRSGDRSALKTASARLNWPPNAVVKRGAELGISRVKESSWNETEQQLLERFGHLAPSGIQRRLAAAGFLRSIGAIQVKLNRGRIKQNLEGYSACGLAGAFGVDVHKVLTWIQRGVLRAVRRGTDRTGVQGGDIWWISRRQVKSFVLRAPEEIDLARVEKIWFLDLLTGGRLCA